MTARRAGIRKYAALLRAVNLAGHNAVPMARLRDIAASLGLQDVKTLLQSGNLVFSDPRSRTPAALESALEQTLERTLGVTTEVYVRDGRELAGVIAKNPFPEVARTDPARLVVSFMKAAVPPARVRALQAAIVGREVVRGAGREMYIHFPDGQGRSKLTPALTQKHIGASSTARNWNTVRKVAALLE